MGRTFEGVKQFVMGLPVAQRATIVGVLVGAIGLLTIVGYWASRPDFALLHSELAPEDASRVVDALGDDGIPYKLKAGGTAIYVPKNRVYPLRLRFAALDLVQQGPPGYTLFDDGSPLGQTDFMQKLNRKRALEGELARTIMDLRTVDVARVHLALPDKTPFRNESVPATASVTLKEAAGGLSSAQIDGIGRLVAGAVEGLAAGRVTILNNRGNLLSSPEGSGSGAAMSADELRITSEYEERLQQKGQSMLDLFLGPGNAILRVGAELDFSRVVLESTSVDPESATVISEEIKDGQDESSTQEAAVRNYAVSETRERRENGRYVLSGLSVSVVLNRRRDTANEDEESTPIPYGAEELRDIEETVKNAVGFQSARGDRFAIHEATFDTSDQDDLAGEMARADRSRLFQTVGRYAVMLVALLAGFWFLKSSLGQIAQISDRAAESLRLEAAAASNAPGLPAGSGADHARGLPPGSPDRTRSDASGPGLLTESVAADDMYLNKLSPEAQARMQAKNLLFEEIVDQIKTTPGDTAELLRSWVADDIAEENVATPTG